MERKCKWCGNTYCFGNAKRTFCSSACKKAAYNSRNRDLVNAKQRMHNKTQNGKDSQRLYRNSKSVAAATLYLTYFVTQIAEKGLTDDKPE